MKNNKRTNINIASLRYQIQKTKYKSKHIKHQIKAHPGKLAIKGNKMEYNKENISMNIIYIYI